MKNLANKNNLYLSEVCVGNNLDTKFISNEHYEAYTRNDIFVVPFYRAIGNITALIFLNFEE